MQRIYNLDKWSLLSEGQSLAFAGRRVRTVRLDVNAPSRTALYIVDQSGEVRFLALVEGRDTIEFGVSGAFQLTVEGADVWIYTADGADISQRVVAPVIFTKIAERRRRNPELEYIAAQMQFNMERRLEQQATELERLFERREAARAAELAGSSDAGGDAGQSEPEPVAADAGGDESAPDGGSQDEPVA